MPRLAGQLLIPLRFALCLGLASCAPATSPAPSPPAPAPPPPTAPPAPPPAPSASASTATAPPAASASGAPAAEPPRPPPSPLTRCPEGEGATETGCSPCPQIRKAEKAGKGVGEEGSLACKLHALREAALATLGGPSRRSYKGQIPEVIKEYHSDGKQLEPVLEELRSLARSAPGAWAGVAYCQQGAAAASLARKLRLTGPPALALFSAKEASIMKKLEASGVAEIAERAGRLREERAAQWRRKRDAELGTAESSAVHLLAQGVLLVEHTGVTHPACERARLELHVYSELLGDDALRGLVRVLDPATGQPLPYRNGMFRRDDLAPKLDAEQLTVLRRFREESRPPSPADRPSAGGAPR